MTQTNSNRLSLGVSFFSMLLMFPAASSAQVVSLPPILNPGQVEQMLGVSAFGIINRYSATSPLGLNVRLVGAGLRYPTVASALSGATSGTLVRVMPGLYTENNLSAASGVYIVGSGMDVTIIRNTSTTGGGGSNPCITLAGGNYVSDIYWNADNADSSTGGIVFTLPTSTIERCKISGTGDTFAVQASSATGRLVIRDNYIVNPYADICKILAQTGGTGAGGALVFDFIRNVVRFTDTAASAIAVGGDFVSVQALMSGPPLINFIQNDIDWRINTAESFNITMLRFQSTSAYSSGSTPLVIRSDGNRLHGETTTKNVVLFQGITGTGVGQSPRYSPVLYSNNDILEIVTSSGTPVLYTGSALTVAGGHTQATSYITNCSFPDTATHTLNTDTLVLRGSSLNRSVTLTDGATVTAAPNLGKIQICTGIAGNRTLAVATGTYHTGQTFTVLYQSSTTAARTMTPDGTTCKGGAVATAANATTYISQTFVYTGSYWVQTGTQGATSVTGY